MKKINEAGIKFSMKSKEDQPHGGSTWDTSKSDLTTYYVAVGVLLNGEYRYDSSMINGYERFNSYTQSYVKLLTMFPKDGGEKYNYIVKAMIGVADDRSEEDLKFAASNSVGKALEDCGIFSMYSEHPRPCKIRKAGDDDNGVSKEVRPRGKEFNESKKRTIRLTESKLKKVISESVKRVLNERYHDATLNAFETFANKSSHKMSDSEIEHALDYFVAYGVTERYRSTYEDLRDEKNYRIEKGTWSLE